MAKAKETGKFDYDAPIEGLQAIDRYTIRLKLNFPDTELLVEPHDDRDGGGRARGRSRPTATRSGWVMANPVGTGPVPAQGVAARPEDRARGEPGLPRRALSRDAAIPPTRRSWRSSRASAFRSIGRVEISIIEEGNPRLLAFEQRELDYVGVPVDLVWNVLDPPATLKPRLAKQGIALGRGIQPAITYVYFNMEDPVVGGYTPDKIALRRAIGMGYNVDEEIKRHPPGAGDAGERRSCRRR